MGEVHNDPHATRPPGQAEAGEGGRFPWHKPADQWTEAQLVALEWTLDNRPDELTDEQLDHIEAGEFEPAAGSQQYLGSTE
jgi:hypothetical protein